MAMTLLVTDRVEVLSLLVEEYAVHNHAEGPDIESKLLEELGEVECL